MKLIESSFEVIKPTGYTLNDIYKSIELAGRVSYKSEDKITEDSAEKFVNRLINSKHYSPLEFGTVYLTIPWKELSDRFNIFKFETDKYSKVIDDSKNNCSYITTNFRVIIENNLTDYLQYICEPTIYHKKRYCVKFILSIGISREFIRHRVFSFMEMSTRYINMSGNKVGNEITFIKPDFIKEESNYKNRLEWEVALINAETSYNNLIKLGYKPQYARGVLPLDTKTELYICGYVDDWKHFFNLRCANNAHPEARKLALGVSSKFISLGYI